MAAIAKKLKSLKSQKRLIQLATGLHYVPKPKCQGTDALAGIGKRSLMKRRDGMKKMTTALAMIALALTLSTMAFGQNGKRTQRGIQGGISPGRQTNGTPTGSVTFGKVKAPQAKRLGTNPNRNQTESTSFNFDKINKAAYRNRLTGAEGSSWPMLIPQAKTQGTSPKEFDKGYLPPNASRGYRGTTTVNQGLRKDDTLSGGSGNDTISTTSVQRRTAKHNRVTVDWGDGTTTAGRRRNFGHFAGPLDHAQVNSNLKASDANKRKSAPEGNPN